MPRKSDDDPEKWEYPAHTKAKHDILRAYLGGWFPKLALGGNQRVLFLDGFAGRGRYNNGEKGSPLIALDTLIDHNAFGQMANREFVFLFVEGTPQNAARLDEVLTEYKAERAPWPPNIKTYVVDATFEESANQLIARLAEQKKSLAPTFAFVDPFGFTGMRMSTIASLLNHRACEVFVNFMIMYVNRFLEEQAMGANMNHLFGLDVPSVLEGYTAGNRVRHLHDVYRNQLRQVAGFDYVQSFAMKNEHGNIEYYLFHGTRSPDGVELMKYAMWKLDTLGTFTFDDRVAGQLSFASGPDLTTLRGQVLQHFQGRAGVSCSEIKQFVNLETLYRAPHLTTVLRQLEKDEKLITVHRPHARAQFGDTVTVDFPATQV
jgi:three-Cys-motif partner protein